MRWQERGDPDDDHGCPTCGGDLDDDGFCHDAACAYTGPWRPEPEESDGDD